MKHSEDRLQKFMVGAGLTLLFAVAVLGLAAVATAQDTPPSINGAKIVSAEEVKTLLAQGAKVYDLRRKAAYVEKHIAGAAYAEYVEKSAKDPAYDPSMDKFDLSQLPADKNAKLIFHGHGVDGWKGYKASLAAVKAGYTNVYWFRGGFAEWVTKGLPTG